MFEKILIANRGVIACRIARTLRNMSVSPVAVYSQADAHSLHVAAADQAVLLGESLASDTYLDTSRIIGAAQQTGAQAIHPGYGFLSENAAFAEECAAHGIVFIGPAPRHIRDFGLKHTARRLAEASGMPLLPGTGLLDDLDHALHEAQAIGYPVMLKSTAGGGGIGMQLCEDAGVLTEAFDSVRRLSRNNFSNAGIFLEKYVQNARHVEVQIFGDGAGKVIALGERDCSLQRRNQKVIEETPAPGISSIQRARMHDSACRLGATVNYRSAGTVEYIYDPGKDTFYFLEVNTRLQVEHGITEEVSGVDLVEWMVRLAADELPDLETLQPVLSGHAIQARVYAEDPARQFQPSSGLLTHVAVPADVRCETWIQAGSEVSPFYDPMLAKIIVHATDRDKAISKLDRALEHTAIEGIETNLHYLRQILTDKAFVQVKHTTRTLDHFDYHASTIDVLAPGTQTTVQDFPGRIGYWNIGVPPSGPMDNLAFRYGNRLLGNPTDAAGLECTITGPKLRFNCASVITLTGAPIEAELDGQPLPAWQAVAVQAGSTLVLGKLTASGARSYLCFRHGLQLTPYLGSRATFTLGQFGGHGGRTLRTGDVLHCLPVTEAVPSAQLPAEQRPQYSKQWTLHVMYGPHGAPDFFTPGDIDIFFATAWEVHYNSSRTGVRLIGPKPQWARADGGEAGLHPSNIHDNAYAIGSIDFTGDMPVILGPDGPSLGGFVCPATVILADRWKLGQLSPGDHVRFSVVDQAMADALSSAQETAIDRLCAPHGNIRTSVPTSAILRQIEVDSNAVAVTYRPCGDRYLLIEYGPQALDINLRFRVHALMLRLQELAIPGVLELTPGIRSLQVHYDSQLLPVGQLLDRLQTLEQVLGDIAAMEVPARVVHLPLSWDDPATRLAIEKYTRSVRPDAPWCPSNIEFIRRINGLDSIEAVREIVFNASYLVMGLGDVYLGAPVATPLDPRHRLVTTKYNPARTWTPENAVGIGGSYLCVYGMEGPGGYQFVGRTLQMWNRWQRTAEFEQPWLLRFFDQIRFFPVSETELLQIREDFPRGGYRLRVEPTTFNLASYNQFLTDNEDSIATFKAQQQAAFDAERERWIAAGQANFEHLEADPIDEVADELELSATEIVVECHVHGSVWQINVEAGASVGSGDTLMVLESMKMEITLHADHAGTVSRILCEPGMLVAPGQKLLVIETAGAGHDD
jgi:urea carboxylase